MVMFLKGAGVVGSVLVLIALIITFLKTLIGFIGFLSFAIKIIIVLVFIALFVSIGFMLLRAWQSKNRPE